MASHLFSALDLRSSLHLQKTIAILEEGLGATSIVSEKVVLCHNFGNIHQEATSFQEAPMSLQNDKHHCGLGAGLGKPDVEHLSCVTFCRAPICPSELTSPYSARNQKGQGKHWEGKQRRILILSYFCC